MRSGGAGTWDQLLTVTQAKLAKPAATTERKLPLQQLVPNPDQPRQFFEPQALAELTESIKAHGVLQPILVRPHPELAGELAVATCLPEGVDRDHRVVVVDEVPDDDASGLTGCAGDGDGWHDHQPNG